MRQHIIRDCPKHINQQSLLGSNRNNNLKSLVGTEAGINHLTKFITHMKDMDKHKQGVSLTGVLYLMSIFRF